MDIKNQVHCSDSIEFSKTLAIKVDSIVTDPPYGINYQGNDWDQYKNCISFDPETWKNISIPLKPGGYIVIFGA